MTYRTTGAALAALTCVFGFASAQPTLTNAGAAANSLAVALPKANHYVCYPVKAEGFKERTATFRDQFGVWEMTIVRPTHLCTPAGKRADNQTYPMTDPRLHMMCYQVRYNSKPLPRVQVTDQFGTMKIGLNPATTVCLPALKKVLE